MKSLALRGALLALFGALTIAIGHWWGLDLDQVALLGVALGGAVGFVPDRTLAQRIGAFVIGFAVAWVGYAARAGLLPDTVFARALIVFVVILVITGAALALGGRFPLWAMLIGAAAMVGAYEPSYVASPAEFLDASPTAATTVLLAVAMGLLGSLLVSGEVEQRRRQEEAARHAEGVSA